MWSSLNIFDLFCCINLYDVNIIYKVSFLTTGTLLKTPCQTNVAIVTYIFKLKYILY